MSTAVELFWKAMGRGLIKPGDKEALQLLMDAASHWREEGKYFNAAYAMSSAVHAAWGDEEQLNSYISAALQDYQHCVEAQDSCSHESFAASFHFAQTACGSFAKPRNVIGNCRAEQKDILILNYFN